ncbi:hypothetical protein [Mycobacterium paraintracellulare]|uniref:hypothetical protein n=1 Tax=Mycobacterium paraintracellulare TaxID=1138383 RepID=UPI001926F55E|nr:hypothetical protein [Mycobacterium paraintracellulare]BCP05635.1 hypothetical protein MINTM019_30910 [Mycobacterium paraintracellulare]
MIFTDKVHVQLKEKIFVAGTATFIVVYDGYVPGIVTTLSPDITFDPAGEKVHSRLQIFLAPFDDVIPPNASSSTLVMSWGPFSSISPDGMIEPHYLNGRLHHYEMIATAFV